MFTTKQIYASIFAISVVFILSYVGNQLSSPFQPKNDEYELIKKYLLNDSPLYGFNKPKIWIHTKYDINARKWKNFQSRTSTDLNQPYIHLTIKTLINHCGNDFNVCLIDDDTFSKLIPSWDIDVKNLAEPMKSQIREIGLLQLIYFYGGMIVPNSFVCLKNLLPLYDTVIANNKPFVCERVNRSLNNAKNKRNLLFIPDVYMMGAAKNDATVLELIEYLKKENTSAFFTSENEFLGITSQWCIDSIGADNMSLISGEFIGIKTQDQKQVGIEELLDTDSLNLIPDVYGIYIPEDELLTRPKFQWFTIMSSRELLQQPIIIAKYLARSILDSANEYNERSQRTGGEMKSAMSI